MKTMFGITQLNEMSTPWQESFVLAEDWDDERYYVSKETYEQEDDEDFTCKYKYVIEACRYGDEKTYVSYILMLVPLPEFWSDKCWENVSELNGYSIEEVKEMAKTDPNRVIVDLVNYGKSVHIGGPGCQYHEEFNNWDDAKFNGEVLDAIAAVVTPIDRMRGFYLDRYVNRIGETGWDEWREILKDVDGCKAALKRWEEENAKSEWCMGTRVPNIAH